MCLSRHDTSTDLQHEPASSSNFDLSSNFDPSFQGFHARVRRASTREMRWHPKYVTTFHSSEVVLKTAMPKTAVIAFRDFWRAKKKTKN